MARNSVEDIESSESLWNTSESDEEDADDDAEDDADACATLCSRSGVSVRLADVRRNRLYSASVICAHPSSVRCTGRYGMYHHNIRRVGSEGEAEDW